jgi:peptidoglycan/xylan/chitin deacetylase (PgdA/CDA1 family)
MKPDAMGITPRMTIVVASSDRSDLEACLGGLAFQSHEPDGFEVIIVAREAESVPNFKELLRSADARLIVLDSRDPAEAWNSGAEASNGEFLLFIRDQFRAAPDLVAAHRAMHLQQSDVVAIGTLRSQRKASESDVVLADQWLHSLKSLRADAAVSLPECAGQTLSMRHETFREVGPFCTGLTWGTEVEMAFRVVKRGGVLLRIPGPVGQAHRPARNSEVEAAAREAGASSVKLYRRAPGLVAELELGQFQRGTRRGLRLRRLLLAIGGPGLPFGLVRRLLPRGRPRERWNTFSLSYQYWRGVRGAVSDAAMWSSLTRAPIILMYHAVAAAGEAAGCYVVPLSRFKRQMAWLKLARYRVLRFEDLLDYRLEHRLPPGRSVVLTFDDGYADNRKLAFPILRAHGFSAIFFLVSAAVGGTNGWDTTGELAGRSLLSWTDIREMLNAGMEMGAHTRHHVALRGVPLEESEQEIAGSRADLERELGRKIRAFAYPYGLLDNTTPDAVARAGFDGACCSRSGANDPVVSSYLLRRLEVRGTDSLLQLIRALGRGHAARRRDRR